MRASPRWRAWVERCVDDLHSRRLNRSLDAVSPIEGTAAAGHAASRLLHLFATNDYLGLSTHPAVRATAAAVAAAHGCGPRASALVCGHTPQHRELERELAALKQAEAALLFPTGYAANLAVLGALADSSECAIFSDALNHASLVDGARLAARGAGAALHVYRHGDLTQLRALLRASDAPRKLIVSDSLFSMDGDVAAVRGLSQLRDEHGALLCLDEAHATLVLGAHGGGAAEAAGVASRVDLHVGTLSKAFGAHGGFVACAAPLRELLLSRGRPGVYSTALPLPVIAAARAALSAATPAVRARLWHNVAEFGAAMGCTLTSPIVPIIVGESSEALAASARLLRAGFHVPAIRPPTVPRGTARLRVALSAAHDPEAVRALARELAAMGFTSKNIHGRL